MGVFITCRVEVRNGMDINAMDEERGRVHADLMGKESAKHLHIPKTSTNTSVTHTDTRNNKSGLITPAQLQMMSIIKQHNDASTWFYLAIISISKQKDLGGRKNA